MTIKTKFIAPCILMILCSCNTRNNELIQLQQENKKLKDSISGITSHLQNEVLNPIAIDIYYGELTEQVNPEFAVFLAYDRPKLIDSVRYTLSQISESNDTVKLQEEKIKHRFKEDYVDVYDLNFNKLKSGKYLVHGYFKTLIMGNYKKLEFKRNFVVK